MGKTKNKRHKSKKPNPTGLPSVRDIELEEEMLGTNEDGDREKNADIMAVQSIVEKLQSKSAEDKECASWNLLTLAENPKAIPLIVEHGIIKMISPLLTDQSILVKHSVAGALRNLSVAGGPDVCDVMIENDVMTPLVALLKQVPSDWTPPANAKAKEDTTCDVLTQAIHLLWNLCESNNTAIKIFNQEGLISIVYQFLNNELYGYDLAIASAHCLHIVSEENPVTMEFLSQSFVMERLEKLISLEFESSRSILLNVLSAGIFLNMKNGKLTGCLSRIASSIMNALYQSLNVNCYAMLETLGECIVEAQKAKEDCSSEQHFYEDPRIGTMKDDIADTFAGQAVALEILTNICCSDDLVDDWNDLDCSDGSDELTNDYMECDEMSMEKFPGILSSEIQEAIVSKKFSEKVMEKIFPLTDAVVKQLEVNPIIGHSLLKRVTTLHCRALLCIHNLMPCLDIEELGGIEYLYSCWISIGKLTLRHTYVCPKPLSISTADCDVPEHHEYLEAVTSALRAILQKLIQTKSFSLDQLTWSDIQMLCNLISTSSESTRNNIINTIGLIGCTLAKKDTFNAEILKNIGLFLLDLCGRDTELVVMAEAMDAIFDVFGEDGVDAVAQQINLIQRLKQTLPGFRHKVLNQKKSLGHHYPVVRTVLTNLIRFIKYKSDQSHCRNGAN